MSASMCTWSSTPVATFRASAFGYLGSSVALSADGQTVLLGAPYTEGESGNARGQVDPCS